MDKKTVTLIIIALAVVLVLFLLYQYGKGKVATQTKLDGASADLEIKRANDEYLAEKEDAYRDRTVKEVTEGSYENALQQTTIAEGYSTLSEYRNSLTEGEKVEYDNNRTTYIEVMGKDPGLMSLEQLREWYKTYLRWSGLNDQYIELTGESKSFLDPEFDTVAEMKAAIKSAETEIEIAQKLAEDEWNEAYIQLNVGTDDLGPFDLFERSELKKYCPNTSDLTAFHTYLMSRKLNWETQLKPKLESFMKNTLYPAIVNDLSWRSRGKYNVDWVNAFDPELCATVASLDPESRLYLMSLYNNGTYKAVNQYTRVNSTSDPHDPQTLYTMSAAMRNRLKISEITYSPINATDVQEVTSFKITHDSPKHCGDEKTQYVTSGKVNQNAINLLTMVFALEQAAREYTYTEYGIALRNGTKDNSVLVQWATDIENFN